MFLKIKSINGSSKVKGMENTIEVLSFNFAGTLPTKSGAQASTASETHGHVQLSDFSVVKHPDSSSPFLFSNMTGGKRMQEDIEFDVNKMVDGKSQTFYTFKMTGALVTSFNTAAAGDLPVESVTFNFTKIKFGYADEDKGKVAAPVEKGWDITLQEAF
jgi:type VI secretion system secreted protein Hcp